MKHERFKEVSSKEEYFGMWDEDNYNNLTKEKRIELYETYLVKCKVFERDEYKCRNTYCEWPDSPITLHHIKWKKNKGKNTLRNCITICKTCHDAFNKGKRGLTFNGMTYNIHTEKEPRIDVKALLKLSKSIRKDNKQYHGLRINWDVLRILIKFLSTPYYEITYCD